MTRPKLLETAIEIALRAHGGQVDKAGAAYITHPIRLMCRMNSDEERVVAVLHDATEESNWTLDDLRVLNCPDEVIHALDCLTPRDAETFDAFIERVKVNPLARRVKIADLEDNMDVRHLAWMTPEDAERILKYQQAWRRLKKADLLEATSMPPGIWLYSVDGIPVSSTGCDDERWDADPPSFFPPTRTRDEGVMISLDEFKELVRSTRAAALSRKSNRAGGGNVA